MRPALVAAVTLLSATPLARLLVGLEQGWTTRDHTLQPRAGWLASLVLSWGLPA